MGKKKLAYIGGTAFVLLVYLAYSERRQWLWLRSNPAYRASEIVGLTKADLIDRLGKPSYMPKPSSPTGVWNEAEDGNEVIAYRGWPKEYCKITFRSGRVTKVEFYSN